MKVVKNKSTVKVYIVRAETEEGVVQKQKADNDNTRELLTIAIKNKHAESKKIAVKKNNHERQD